MQAIALIHEENGTYTASFPDFPECTAVAGDPDSVIVRATEALAQHIDRSIENGRELPRARSLAVLAADPIFAASSVSRMIALVAYGSTQPVRLSIAVEEGLLARIDRAAEAVSETRSGYLSRAARQRLIREAGVEVPRMPEASAEGSFDARGASYERLEKSPFPNATPIDAAASLASIREMLERLDAPTTEDARQPLLRPARRGVL